MKPNTTTAKKPQPKPSRPHSRPVRQTHFRRDVNELGMDGEDHINIHGKAKTELGRYIDFGHMHWIEHPVLGSFRSIYSLWSFLKAKQRDDQLRRMPIQLARKHIQEYCGGTRDKVPNFRAIILDTFYHRLKVDRHLQKLFLESSLPFDNYRTLDSGIRERFEQCYWIVPAIEMIRTAMKNGQEPDFSPYIHEGTDIYGAILKEMVPEMKIEEPKSKKRREVSDLDLNKETRTKAPTQEEVKEAVIVSPEEVAAVVMKGESNTAMSQAFRELLASRNSEETAAVVERKIETVAEPVVTDDPVLDTQNVEEIDPPLVDVVQLEQNVTTVPIAQDDGINNVASFPVSEIPPEISYEEATAQNSFISSLINETVPEKYEPIEENN
jgi:hypothetical protein